MVRVQYGGAWQAVMWKIDACCTVFGCVRMCAYVGCFDHDDHAQLTRANASEIAAALCSCDAQGDRVRVLVGRILI